MPQSSAGCSGNIRADDRSVEKHSEVCESCVRYRTRRISERITLMTHTIRQANTQKPAVSLPLNVRDCGLIDYQEALEMQHRLRDEKTKGQIPNTVLIVEHPPAITLGARQSANKLLIGRQELANRNIDVVDIRRGGGTTAHNPGQLVFYPILDLRQLGLGINEYIRKLEAIGIELLERFGVIAERHKGAPGLWIGDKKIASIGVRVSRFITYHGMAINICNDLSIFDLIVPCGLDNVRMTSVLEETSTKVSMNVARQHLAELLIRHLSSTER